MSGKTIEQFDCQSCAACCVVGGEVVVSPEDPTPRHLTRSVRGLIGFAFYEAEDGHRRMARTNEGACVALRGNGSCGYSCRIYDRRPTNCREFEPGSRPCLAARSRAQIVAGEL